MTREERIKKSMDNKARLSAQFFRFTSELILPTLVASQDERVVVKMSPDSIVDTYGQNCERIFRLLFTLYQVGGISVNKERYVTMWVANKDNMAVFCNLLQELSGTQYTPKFMLDELTRRGCTESRRVKVGDRPEVISGKALEDHKQMVKRLRELERLEKEYQVATYWH